MALENILECLLDCKIKPVNLKEISPEFIGKTDAAAETPILWPSDVKNWLIGKDPDAGKDWRREEKGTTDDITKGWISNSIDMSFSKLQKLVKDRKAWNVAVHGITKTQTWLINWTELNSESSEGYSSSQNKEFHIQRSSWSKITKHIGTMSN